MPTLLVHTLPSWPHIAARCAFLNDLLVAHDAVKVILMYHAVLDQPFRAELELSYPRLLTRRVTLMRIGDAHLPPGSDPHLVRVQQMTDALDAYLGDWPADTETPFGVVLDGMTPRPWFKRLRGDFPDMRFYSHSVVAAALHHVYSSPIPQGLTDYAQYVEKYAHEGMSKEERHELRGKIILARNGHTELNGTVVPMVGLPDVYDYERELGYPPTPAAPDVIVGFIDTMGDWDGMLLHSSLAIEREAIEYITAVSRGIAVGASVSPRAWAGSLLGAGPISEFLQSQRRNSVLYISFGTIFFPEKYVDVVLATLLDMQQPFIFCCGVINRGRVPDALVERINASSRAHIVFEWVDQIGILSHPAVGWMCSHGGWISTLEAIAAGKPIIAWPVARILDQGLIAALISTREKPLGFELLQVRTGHAQRPAKRGVDVLGTPEAVASEIREVMRQAFKCEAGRVRKRHVLEMREQLQAEQEGSGRAALREWFEREIREVSARRQMRLVNATFDDRAAQESEVGTESEAGTVVEAGAEERRSDMAKWAAKVHAEVQMESAVQAPTSGFPAHLLNGA